MKIIYTYIDDIRISMKAFSAAKHNIIATHIANKQNDVYCLAVEYIIIIYLVYLRDISCHKKRSIFS